MILLTTSKTCCCGCSLRLRRAEIDSFRRLHIKDCSILDDILPYLDLLQCCMIFITRQHAYLHVCMHSAILLIPILSVCPSNAIHGHIVTLFRRSDREIILVFIATTPLKNSKGNSSAGGVKYKGVGIFFCKYRPFISKTVRDSLIVTVEHW